MALAVDLIPVGIRNDRDEASQRCVAANRTAEVNRTSMTRLSVLYVLCFAVVAPPSCAHFGAVSPGRFDEIMDAKVRKQAAFDLQCPENQLSISKIDVRSFGVSGCGNRGTFVATPAAHCSTTAPEQNVLDFCTVVPASRMDTNTANSNQK